MIPVDPITQLSAARFAVYVHFPYCLSKCPYCDFASTVVRQIPERRYADAVLRECEVRLAAAREVHSIYFGGGTPSLWDARYVAALLDAFARRFRLSDEVEVTLEANPGASDAARFADFRAAGVNRLSIGVQSFEPSTLKALGREHDGPTALKAYQAARKAGFDNVSLDFIYGVHGQTREQAVRDAIRAVELAPDHLSAYALTLEKEALAEEVPLARQLARGEVSLPPDEEVVAMAREIRAVYASAGLWRYEISNYARPGRHSRHNAAYWTGGEYLALGVGATGCLATGDRRAERYTNLRSAEAYLSAVEAGRLPEAAREGLGPLELFRERLAMGLRLSTGVDLEGVCRTYEQPYAPRARLATELAAHGLARFEGGRLALTDEGADLHSEISARLM